MLLDRIRDTYLQNQHLAQRAAEPLRHQRTTSSLVFGCIFTLLLWTWCCVRPDFPNPKASRIDILKTRLHIAFWMLVAPELLLYWSFRQWWEAGIIASEYRARGWTRKTGLFLVMGGCMLYDGDRPVQTISIQHLRRFLLSGAIDFPSLSDFETSRSNKLHPLIYIFAFAQTLWFVVQCITRLASGLLVSQLEVLTLTLVFINTLNLIFTWHKPVDVRYPFRVDALNQTYSQPERPPQVVFGRIARDYKREVGLTRNLKYIFTEERRIDSRPIRTLKQIVCRLLRVTLFNPVDTIFRDFGRLAINMQSSVVSDGALNVPTFYAPDTADFLQFTFPVIVLLGMGINAVLCLFWSWGYFPSFATRMVWRVCASISAGFCALSLLLIVIISITQIWNQIAFNNVTDLIGDFFIYLAIFAFLITFLPFVFARIVLIVESFICLISLPLSGLQVLPWTTYIPHIS